MFTRLHLKKNIKVSVLNVLVPCASPRGMKQLRVFFPLNVTQMNFTLQNCKCGSIRINLMKFEQRSDFRAWQAYVIPKHHGPINRRPLPNTKRKDDPPPNAPPTSYFSSICQCHIRQAKEHTYTQTQSTLTQGMSFTLNNTWS